MTSNVNKKEAYAHITGACRNLILTRKVEIKNGPSIADAHAFILLWQAQCAIVLDCDIFHPDAIAKNLQTSGRACSRTDFYERD